jgi:hypothetical protein
VGANHRKEAISGLLRLEQVRRGELRMVCHWIGSTNLELDPKSKAIIEFFEDHIRAGRVAE